MRRNPSLLFILAILGAASSACSVYVNDDRQQCKQDPDCAALGKEYTGYTCQQNLCQPPVDQTWTCLDGVYSEPATGKVHVGLTLVDLVTLNPLPGATLTLCSKYDSTCSSPIPPQYQSDAAGQLDIEMPAGFDGYFQAEGAGIYPSLIFPPNTRKQRTPSTIPLMPASFYSTMLRGVGTAVAADRSVILMTALDCLGRPAAGLTLTSAALDTQTASYVLADGMPSRTITTTDDSGSGGFVNIPAGPAIINSVLVDGNRPVGTIGIQARPGYVSMAVIMPNGS